MITAVNPVVVPLILSLALGFAWILSRSHAERLNYVGDGRFVAIDGLRGYLAFFVFLHHACVWYFYLQTGRWEVPPSNLFVMLGQGSVVLFFMVTSFLFTTKILEDRGRRVSWFKFYVLRVARLTPLYLLVIGVLLLFVAMRSDWKLTDSIGSLVDQLYRWLTFTIAGKPDINGIQKTSIMVASVTWSLPFEWFFYLCLPLLTVSVGGRLSRGGIAFSCIALYLMFEVWAPKMIVVSSFLGGMIAATIIHQTSMKTILAGKCCSWIVLIILLVVFQLPTAFDSIALALLSLAFLIVAADNRLFGMLDNGAVRWLGELSYGIYLLHGLILYFFFHFVFGFDMVRGLAPLLFWILVCLVTPFVLLAAHVAHLGIERPVMKWIKELLSRRHFRALD